MSRNLCAKLLAVGSLAAGAGPLRSNESVSIPGAGGREPSDVVRAGAPPATDAQDPELDALRELVDEARRSLVEKDPSGARAGIAAAIEEALAEIGEREDAAALELLAVMATFAHDCGELHWAEKAGRRVLEVRARILPEDHPDLQKARGNLASTLSLLGDLEGARALFEQVVESFSRTLPEDHAALQWARGNLAVTIKTLGDLQGARMLEEQVLEVRSRTLPGDHPDLQTARQRLAGTIAMLGDLESARTLQEQVLEVCSRTLPEGHSELQWARGNLAVTIKALGDLQGARSLEEQVLEVRSRTLPQDHPDLQKARVNLASTIGLLGDLQGARSLYEQVLEVRSRILPEDHPDLQRARQNVANTIYLLGDLQGARSLYEQVLEVRSRILPEDHPDLQAARGNLAVTIQALGDLEGARALQEKVLEVSSRTLPVDHPDLQKARLNLAATSKALGDLQGARSLQEQALAAFSRTLPEDHPDLQAARANLASTIGSLGDLQGARALQEQVLEVVSRIFPPDHPDLQEARQNLAWTLAHERARSARTRGGDGEDRCAELVEELCRSQTAAARAVLLSSTAREAEARCERLSASLDTSLSFAAGLGVFEPVAELERASFVLSETTRGAALGTALLMRRSAGTARHSELREELRGRSAELASLVQTGATSVSFHQALERREAVEQELVALARELSGGRVLGLDFDLESLAGGLAERDAVVAYRRYERASIARSEQVGAPKSPSTRWVASLCAFVVRSRAEHSPGSSERAVLTLVELGPIEPIEQAVRAWRAGLGSGADERGVGVASVQADAAPSRGEELRGLAFDPLEGALVGAERVVMVLDDVLHLVPIEALPLRGAADGPDAGLSLGDSRRFETRCTLTELMAVGAPSQGAGTLVSLGGASFDSEPLGADAEDLAAHEESEPAGTQAAAILRGGAWERGFGPLTYTGFEARDVADLHDEAFGESAGSVVLEKRKASRAALEELAPKARWLHVATHGWFASESIRSWKDEEPLDKHSGLGLRISGEQQVRGMSPMLLCGLALAGASLPVNELGRVPGLITAEELAALDLSSCELAVLSACDTNVGERRAGQGVASLQKALQMAGARSVITSLWKVPDEATRELMSDFYRRIWVEGKPKAQALWEAKRRLREATDEGGRARYTTRDWAAWVLTGEPD